MDSPEGWLVFALVLLAGIVAMAAGLAVTWRRRRTLPSETDYRTFFVVGIWCLVGGAVALLVFTMIDLSWSIAMPILIIGIVFTSIGWGERARWPRR